MATDDLPRELPPDTKITLLQSSPEILEIRLRPGGWRFQYTYFAVFWTSLITVPMMMLFPPWEIVQPKNWWFVIDSARRPPNALAIAMFACCTPFILWMANVLYRQAYETTRIQIEAGRATVTRSGAAWREKIVSFALKEITTRSAGRKSEFRLIVLKGENTRAICCNLLSHEDADWLVQAIKKWIHKPVDNIP